MEYHKLTPAYLPTDQTQLEPTELIEPMYPSQIVDLPTTNPSMASETISGTWFSIVSGSTVSLYRTDGVVVPCELFAYYFYSLPGNEMPVPSRTGPKLPSTLSVGLRQPSVDHPHLTRVIDSIDPKKLLLIFSPEVWNKLSYEELRSRVPAEVTMVFEDPMWKLPTDYYYTGHPNGHQSVGEVLGEEIERVIKYYEFETHAEMPMPMAWNQYICPRERNRLFTISSIDQYAVIEGGRFSRLAAGELDLFIGTDLNFWAAATDKSVGFVTRPMSKTLRALVQRTLTLGGCETELLLIDAPESTSVDDLDHHRIVFADGDYHAKFRRWIRNRTPLMMVIFLGSEDPMRYQQLMSLVHQHPVMISFILEPERKMLPLISNFGHFWCLDCRLDPAEIEPLSRPTTHTMTMGFEPTPKMLVPTLLRHRETQPSSLLVLSHPLSWIDLDPEFAEKEYAALQAEKADESKKKKKPMITVEVANEIISELQTSEELYEQLCDMQQQLEQTHRRLSELIGEYVLPYADISKMPPKQIQLDM